MHDPVHELLNVSLRILHIFAAATAIGAIVFQRFAVLPALAPCDELQRAELRTRMADRWRPLIYTMMAILLVTGLVNYVVFKIPEYKFHPGKGFYHGLFGVKFLAALGVFHFATVLTLPGARGDRWRARSRLWLQFMLALVVLIVVIGAVLRNFQDLFG